MKIIKIIILFNLFSSQLAYSTESDHWNYIGLGRIIIDNSSDDAKGFGLDTKTKINDMFYFNGKFQQYSTSTTDIDRILIGVGGVYEVNDYFSPFAQIDYVYLESKPVTVNSNILYWIVALGVSGNYNKLGYKVGLNQYEAIIEKELSGSGHFAEIFYSFTDKLSAGIELESITSDDIYNISVRYHF